jgi:hypothetical protein
MNEDTMKLGLLMESVQAQQKLVEANIAGLQAHTRDLDEIVRDTIRRTLIEELEALTAESRRAATALQSLGRLAISRAATWGFGLTALCSAIPGAVLWWSLPSGPEIAALRAQRDELTTGIARLQAAGGQIEWRRCGATLRLCVRIERAEPAYGDHADFLIVKGH